MMAAVLIAWDSGAASPPKVSPALTQVVKLSESGVAEDVVLAYIHNSRVPKPNADEIIYLHEAGVSKTVVMALLAKNGASETAGTQPVARAESSTPQGASERVLARPEYAQTSPAVSAPTRVYVESPPPVYVQPTPPTVVYAPAYPPSYAYGYADYPYPYYGGYYAGPSLALGFSFGGHHGFGHHGFGHHSFGHHFGGHHSGHGFGGGHHGGHFAGHSGHH